MKVFKGQENLLLKNLQEKTRVENVRFLSWRIFFVGKYGIQSTNEMAFKRTVTLRASFRFPAIRFDAPKLLSFSGFTHAHAKCPPVGQPILVPRASCSVSRRGLNRRTSFRLNLSVPWQIQQDQSRSQGSLLSVPTERERDK